MRTGAAPPRARRGGDGRARPRAGRPVIGVAFDGTGYGTDGAVWGGEVLVAGLPRLRRAAHLGYVPLPGGDAAVRGRTGWRWPTSHAAGVPGTPTCRRSPPARRPSSPRSHQLTTGLGCVPTSSMGRLFDAVARSLGVGTPSDYEAQAAIELEGRARRGRPDGEYAFALVDDGTPLRHRPGAGPARAVADVPGRRAGRARRRAVPPRGGRRSSSSWPAASAQTGARHGRAQRRGVPERAAARRRAAALRADGFTVLATAGCRRTTAGWPSGQLVVRPRSG